MVVEAPPPTPIGGGGWWLAVALRSSQRRLRTGLDTCLLVEKALRNSQPCLEKIMTPYGGGGGGYIWW